MKRKSCDWLRARHVTMFLFRTSFLANVVRGCAMAGPEGETTEAHRKGKGRTGWPQHVWALELKQEQVMSQLVGTSDCHQYTCVRMSQLVGTSDCHQYTCVRMSQLVGTSDCHQYTFVRMSQLVGTSYCHPSNCARVIQLVAHDPYRASLLRMNLSETSLCCCGGKATREHVTFECTFTESERAELLMHIHTNAIYHILRDVDRWSYLDEIADRVSKPERDRHIDEQKKRRQRQNQDLRQIKQEETTEKEVTSEDKGDGEGEETSDLEETFPKW
uniref:(California timema) hypothetical protein n=1 Tax=Timema californicum TaxID=61474 RepID=A0A7R9PAR0_TIMCA|nr:unnamed protein product [Timema californicum]